MLELRDVTKRYGALTALGHVSFSVGPGEVLGYLGPNDSGKSLHRQDARGPDASLTRSYSPRRG